MQTKSWKTVLIFSSFLTLSACQTLLTTSSESNPVSISSNSYENEIYEPPTTLIPPIPDSDGDGILDDIDNCPKTPTNTVVDNRGCPYTEPEPRLKIEYRAYFAEGSSELRSDYQLKLDEIAAKMKKYDSTFIKITAHTAENEEKKQYGSNTIPNYLAKDRALTIKDYLVLNYLISSDRILTGECSDQAPIAPNHTYEGRAMNRRVYGVVEEYFDSIKYYSYSPSCVEF